MSEVELKFQVPAARRQALQRALVTPKARTLRLQAQYFDTPDRRLAAAGITLRLRQQGQAWVQTLKCPGGHRWARLEHEVPRAAEAGEPVLDLALHADTEPGRQLTAALGNQGGHLQVVYTTEVQRSLRAVRGPGLQAEMALDVGQIRAGNACRELYELEFELKAGSIDALVALATRWAERHRLWLDVVTKPERGEQLAQGARSVAPVHAQPLVLGDPQSPDAALRQMVGACLAHLLPNVAEIAGGVASPEHLHQARVALRRLRTALRLYGDWSPEADAQWAPALATLFAQLGALRDRDALEAGLLPALHAAGAPGVELPDEAAAADLAEILRGPACTRLWLALIAFASGTRKDDVLQPAGDARALAAARLKRLRRQLARDARAYAGLADEQRHRARRRLKRLRYGIEFTASLFREKKVEAYLAHLKPAQDALGEYNDLVVAEQVFARLVPAQPQAWFALGWLAARRAGLLQASQRRLQKWAQRPGFW